MDDLERTYTPAEATELIAFAPSLLRRYAAIYEAIGGSIPHDRRGGRIYSGVLLEHFSQARERVRAGETVEDALRTLDLAPTKGVTDVQTTLDAKDLLSLLERLADANEQLAQEVVGLRAEVAEVQRAQLEPPTKDRSELEETRRMNTYLLGELERRAAVAAPSRRPWWLFWGRQR